MDQDIQKLQLPDLIDGTGVDLDEMETLDRQRVLVVDDEPDTVSLLKSILRIGGLNVLSAVNGHEALKKATDHNPDLVLLDLMMPEMDGWEVFRFLKQMSDVPVIIISARAEKDSVVAGLLQGADDYITKPFFNSEVVARVHSVLRRTGKPQEVSHLVFPGVELSLDLNSQEANLKGVGISLTPKEFAILSVLARHAPAIASYQTIAQEIWGIDSEEIRKRTKYLIYLLRRKFAHIAPGSNLILNVDRLGYKLKTE